MLICSSSHTHTSFKFIGFWFLVFGLTDFRFHVKNIDIYSFMYIRFYPYATYFKVVSISCFCIYMSFGENGFPFQSLVFGKYGFRLKTKLQYHKNGSNYL